MIVTYRNSILSWIRKRPALFSILRPISLIGILLLGYGRPSSIQWLSPLATFIGYALILLGAYHVKRELTSIRTLFWHLILPLSSATAIQLFWLTSHPYAYMWVVWPIISTLLAVPLSLLFSFALYEIIQWTERNDQLPSSQTRVHFFFTLIALSLAAFEGSLAHIWPGISFFTSSLMLTWHAPAAQLASYFGRESLSFLIFLTNLEGVFFLILLVEQWKERRAKKIGSKLLYPFIVWILLGAFPYLSGTSVFSPKDPGKRVNMSALIVHMDEDPDIFEAQLKKPWDITTDEWKKVLQALDHSGKTEENRYDIIAIPEGAIPYPADALIVNLSELKALYPHLLDSSFVQRALFLNETNSYWGTSLDASHIIANTLQTPLLIGLEGRNRDGLSREEGGTQPIAAFNSAFFVLPKKPMSSRYDKQLLIPFGEYIPFSWMKDILALYGVHGSFTQGIESKVYTLPLLSDTHESVRFSPLICYEETFSSYGIGCRRKGAELIISVSNDTWFPSKRLAREHFHLAQLQAIELKIPVIRSTNMGMSGVIDEKGNIIASYIGSKNGENISFTTPLSVQKEPPLTFYVQTYEIRNLITIIVLLLGWALYLREKIKRMT